MKYVIYEKSYIDRLGEKIDDEINIGDSDSVLGILRILELKRNFKTTKMSVYRSIKNKEPIRDKYIIFKMKD